MIKDKDIIKWFDTDNEYEDKEIIRILEVDYAHLKLSTDDDLYVTRYGLPFIKNLLPENFFTDKEWFQNNSYNLNGTSCVFKVKTKKINSLQKDIVLKWNRMGQDIPGARNTEEFLNAEFNSPFEEFSLVSDLIDIINSTNEKITIQKPFAIYVPGGHKELWRIGRREYKMQEKIKAHTEIDLDMHRSYSVIYEWIEGLDAVQAFDKKILEKKYLEILTTDAAHRIKEKGFIVRDNKPHHIIVTPDDKNKINRNTEGKIDYALVDFELLEMTPEYEEAVKKVKRINYLKRQKERFSEKYLDKLHPNLKFTNIMGADYIYGRVESTKGALWVVGKDPFLFDYFLPERWEHTPKRKISRSREIFYTFSKDNIHLVWKWSRVGLIPDMDPFKEDENRILEFGYNSPFEEISIALFLNMHGIATIYPRAIYMTGSETMISEDLTDMSRYENHKGLLTPGGSPILKMKRNYITIWGYWNGPDEMLAAKDGDYYNGITLLNALREGVITKDIYLSLMNNTKGRLQKIGIEDLHLRGNHLMISLDNSGNIVEDKENLPEIRISNFEFFRKRGHQFTDQSQEASHKMH